MDIVANVSEKTTNKDFIKFSKLMVVTAILRGSTARM
tara:strand:- start:384 stop:494 length:111 start_codon:yes stop_codon:yes gene_type:complete